MLHTLYCIVSPQKEPLATTFLYWGDWGWTDDLSKAHTFLTMESAESVVLDEELFDTRVEPIEID